MVFNQNFVPLKPFYIKEIIIRGGLVISEYLL